MGIGVILLASFAHLHTRVGCTPGADVRMRGRSRPYVFNLLTSTASVILLITISVGLLHARAGCARCANVWNAAELPVNTHERDVRVVRMCGTLPNCPSRVCFFCAHTPPPPSPRRRACSATWGPKRESGRVLGRCAGRVSPLIGCHGQACVVAWWLAACHVSLFFLCCGCEFRVRILNERESQGLRALHTVDCVIV